jgi:predicted ATP-binding protein involved in virulence
MTGTSRESTSDLDQLLETIEQASRRYFPLVILVGVSGSGKTATLQSIGKRAGCNVLNVNLELSKKMLELSRIQRSRQIEKLLKEAIASSHGEVVLLDNLEILFDSALDVEPVRLLQVVSRNRPTVASWTGSYFNGTLAYAEAGHPEFAQFHHVDAVVINIANTATN